MNYIAGFADIVAPHTEIERSINKEFAEAAPMTPSSNNFRQQVDPERKDLDMVLPTASFRTKSNAFTTGDSETRSRR